MTGVGPLFFHRLVPVDVDRDGQVDLVTVGEMTRGMDHGEGGGHGGGMNRGGGGMGSGGGAGGR